MSQIDAMQSVLLTLSNLLRENYIEQVPQTSFRFGRVTERLFAPAEQVIDGDGTRLQVVAGRTDSARATRNPLRDFPYQRPMITRKLRLRFDAEDTTANDFGRMDAVAEIPHLDMIRGNVEEVALNLEDEVTRQLNENIQDSHPILLHAQADGRVALVNGTPVNDNTVDFASGSTYTSSSTSCRFKVDGGSIAMFEPGTRWDIYNSSGTLLADEVEVTHKNPADLSVAAKLTTTGPADNRSTVANCDSIADNAYIYRSKEKGQGLRSSLTNWFANPTASESFIGGVDRTTSDYRWLLPTHDRVGSASAAIRADFLDDMALAQSYVIEEGKTPAIIGHSSLIQTLRKSIGNDALRTEPAVGGGNYTFGELGVTFQHPQFGQVTLLSDPLAPPDNLKFMVPQNWKKYHYGFSGFMFFPGDIGYWFRKEGANPGGGKSVFYRCEGYELYAYFCHSMRDQGITHNLTA